MALFTVALGLGGLALALDPQAAPDAVAIREDAVRWILGVAGALHALLGARALVRLFGGRWAEHGTRAVTAADRRRLVAISVLDDLTGTALVVLGLLGGAGDAVELDGWARPAAVACGVLLSVLGMGLLVVSLRPRPDELPPGVAGTSWRRTG